MIRVSDVREQFARLYRRYQAGEPIEVAGTLEIVGSSFVADDVSIFGRPDPGYIARELEWYLSQSLSVNDIQGGPPKIWAEVADDNGIINSNYGHLFMSDTNGAQMQNVVEHLKREPEGRRAVAVYTNPQIHERWNEDGRRDFICTNAVNYYKRAGKLHAVVQMRSNDAVFGYRNDYAWQLYALQRVAESIGTIAGTIIWQPGSLHVYARHYHLLERYCETGEWLTSVKKSQP